MLKGKTKTGFEFAIKDESLDDYELLELCSDIDAGNGGAIPRMASKLLGKEQKEALKEHLRETDGRVSAQKMLAEIEEILTSSDQGKNS